MDMVISNREGEFNKQNNQNIAFINSELKNTFRYKDKCLNT